MKPFGSNFDAYFASPEDVILKKMEFYHEGGSEKHLRDIAGMLKIRGEQVDRSYISEWAQKLGLEDVWAAHSVKSRSAFYYLEGGFHSVPRAGAKNSAGFCPFRSITTTYG